MKSLVTGSGGFIGSHLVKALEERGDEVFKLHHEEMHDKINMSIHIPDDVDYIFHLSAYGNMANQKEDIKIFNANLVNTMRLLEVTKDIPYKAFVNVSSSSVSLPHQTIYSATKLGAEALCKAFVDEYDKPIVTVRPYSVYGPGEADFRFIPTVFRSCLTGEEMTLVPDAVHDWVYVGNFVREMIKCAERVEVIKGHAFKFGTSITTSNKEVVTMVEKIAGKKAHYKVNKGLRSFDSKDWKAKDKSYFADTPLKEGLEKCYEFYKERYDK